MIHRFEQNYIPEPNSGCWLWLGTINADGYGCFAFKRRRMMAHRASLELVGVAIDGLQVDHLCRVRCCVNPEHLEPVTPRENTLRARRSRPLLPEKIHCAYGHALALVGSFLREGRKTPTCMECARISREKYRKTTRSTPTRLESTMSATSSLPFQVECKSTFLFFEPIAAFNHIKVAYGYAQDCLRTNPKFEYRLRDIESGKTYKVNAYRGWGAVA